jgi:hypothetical protein
MKKEQGLSEAQILHLFDFVKSKYVRYIDVQHEIVDHLASAIEEEMENDESLNFEQALSLVYSRFPITGFAEIIGEKEKAMTYYWWRKVFIYMKAYYTVPKIIFTFSLTILLYFVISIFKSYGFAVIVITGVILSCMSYIKYAKLIKGINESNKLLFLQCFLGASLGIPWLGFIPQLFFNSYNVLILSPLESILVIESISLPVLLVAGIFSFLYLYWHASYYVFPTLLKEEVERKYKQLHLVLNFD